MKGFVFDSHVILISQGLTNLWKKIKGANP